ncbi:MAG: hypothetical protein HQL86_08845 [Magnetococcales bacterium]|nr:hypothetical protein [Magnetococcales bacterium]
MPSFDWISIVQSVAPTIATALGSPLAGLGVRALSEALLGHPNGSESDVAQAVEMATPDQLLAMKKADQEFAVKMKELDIDLEKAYLDDVADARATFGHDNKVFWVGIVTLLTFAGLVLLVLLGAFRILTDGITIEQATMTVVVAVISAIVSTAGSNAQTVINWWFGSSKTSAEKTTAMTNTISDAMSKLRQK